MYVCMYVWKSDLAVCMYVCKHACMYVCMHACMYVCTHVRTYVCMYVCIPCPGNDLCIICSFQEETKQKTMKVTIDMCLRRYLF